MNKRRKGPEVANFVHHCKNVGLIPLSSLTSLLILLINFALCEFSALIALLFAFLHHPFQSLLVQYGHWRCIPQRFDTGHLMRRSFMPLAHLVRISCPLGQTQRRTLLHCRWGVLGVCRNQSTYIAVAHSTTRTQKGVAANRTHARAASRTHTPPSHAHISMAPP